MNKNNWLLLLGACFLGTAAEVAAPAFLLRQADALMSVSGQQAVYLDEPDSLEVLNTEDIWKNVYREVMAEKAVSSEVILNLALTEVKNKDLELMSSATDHIVSYHGRRFAITDDDYQILLRIVEAEAGDEDLKGKMLVANVVLNRLEIGFGGDTISEVVFDEGQFQPVSNGRIFKVTVSESTKEAVECVLKGEDVSKGALYFMARDFASEKGVQWFDSNLKFLFRHGGHEFYKEK